MEARVGSLLESGRAFRASMPSSFCCVHCVLVALPQEAPRKVAAGKLRPESANTRFAAASLQVAGLPHLHGHLIPSLTSEAEHPTAPRT